MKHPTSHQYETAHEGGRPIMHENLLPHITSTSRAGSCRYVWLSGGLVMGITIAEQHAGDLIVEYNNFCQLFQSKAHRSKSGFRGKYSLTKIHPLMLFLKEGKYASEQI